MNAPLPFVLTSSFADVGTNVAGVCVDPMAPLGLRDRPGNGKHPAFVERRRPDTGMSDSEVRSPAVLGFVGLVWGLVVSAVLTLGVSAGLTLAGVSWMAAGHYCAAIILLVFGLVGMVLYRGTRGEHPSMAGIQRPANPGSGLAISHTRHPTYAAAASGWIAARFSASASRVSARS